MHRYVWPNKCHFYFNKNKKPSWQQFILCIINFQLLKSKDKFVPGESNGYLLLNLNNSWKCSPSYNVPSTPSIFILHRLEKKQRYSNGFKTIFENKQYFADFHFHLTWYNYRFFFIGTYFHCVKFWLILSASTTTPGGGSLINDISSFCNRRYNSKWKNKIKW